MRGKFSSEIPNKQTILFKAIHSLKKMCNKQIGVLKQVVTSTDTHPNAMCLVQIDAESSIAMSSMDGSCKYGCSNQNALPPDCIGKNCDMFNPLHIVLLPLQRNLISI